ncbi:hypothetical protein [Longicatena caecimuris]|uniref:hypothetical protein n=1 Tax=Longicatena caecimuris TaxID=1796635 RepID=UPI000E73604B|nr:hypothetical protein [Longicatena caecimuris]RJV81510.1 hypothetical protein DW969_01680 [Eubacterium sp. AM47-9]RJW07641.1 hypothetical protein DW751_09320 [Eubacterium sp. AM28-8LB]
MMIDKMRAWTILRYHDCAFLLSGAESVKEAHNINKSTEKFTIEIGMSYKDERSNNRLHTKYANKKAIHKSNKSEKITIEWCEYDTAELIDFRYLYLVKNGVCVGGYYIYY